MAWSVGKLNTVFQRCSSLAQTKSREKPTQRKANASALFDRSAGQCCPFCIAAAKSPAGFPAGLCVKSDAQFTNTLTVALSATPGVEFDVRVRNITSVFAGNGPTVCPARTTGIVWPKSTSPGSRHCSSSAVP